MTYLKPQPPSSAEKNLEKGTYFEQLKPLGKIPSIEHFFNYYVHMKKPTEMPREIDIFFFRDQEVPMWEVSSSSNKLNFRNHQTVESGSSRSRRMTTSTRCGSLYSSLWLVSAYNLDLMHHVGEQFEEPSVIGASLSLRTKERLLQVWLKDGRSQRVRTNVSNKIRHFL